MIRVIAERLAIAALLTGLACGSNAHGEDSVQERLSSDRLGRIETGTYLAGEKIGFELDPAGDGYLLRFDDSPEVFVLHTDNASMGGRVLKYDSGETALQVSGWGGITLYTDADPAGLPAVRTGDSVTPMPAATSIADVQNAAQDDAQHLAFVRRLNLAFGADWSSLAADAGARSLALEALENVARGLDRFGRSAQGHDALAHRVNTVMLAIAGRPTVTLDGKKLMVTFDPGSGYEGCASSRAISRALVALLAARQKQN
ncbi:MAG TPA: DUF4908 domain-containing protein [Rhizomicrobium sp.]|nr:DUF4908 domain-containing protein [Rhizomicrobium sp.]